MRKFGLIGYPLSHSFSQRYFTEKFEREQIPDCSYSAYSLEHIDLLRGVLADPALCGLNVTIPYKEKVMAFLDVLDPVVSRIQACNCIAIREGRLHGFNTDVVGFRVSLQRRLAVHHDRALVLGTGGASKAVEYTLEQLGIPYLMVSRGGGADTGTLRYEDVTVDLMASHRLVINTTPLGMYPKVDECPALPYEAVGAQHYFFDLVYNPARTLFLQQGGERGAVVENGHEMLVLQAEESWRIWNEGVTS